MRENEINREQLIFVLFCISFGARYEGNEEKKSIKWPIGSLKTYSRKHRV